MVTNFAKKFFNAGSLYKPGVRDQKSWGQNAYLISGLARTGNEAKTSKLIRYVLAVSSYS